MQHTARMDPIEGMQGRRPQTLSSDHGRIEWRSEDLRGKKVERGALDVPAGHKAGHRDSLLPTQVLVHSNLVPQVIPALLACGVVPHLWTHLQLLPGVDFMRSVFIRSINERVLETQYTLSPLFIVGLALHSIL